MAEAKIQVELKDIDPVKSLIRTLSNRFIDLPEDVQVAVRDLLANSEKDPAVSDAYEYRQRQIDRICSLINKSDSTYSAVCKLYDAGLVRA